MMRNAPLMRMTPKDRDLVVRKKSGNPSAVYVQHTASTTDGLLYRTQEEATSQARAAARQQNVSAWFAHGDDFVLLGTFGKEDVDP